MTESEALTLTVEQTARATHLSERMIRELIATGEMPCVRVGRRVLILRTQLEAFLNARATTAA